MISSATLVDSRDSCVPMIIVWSGSAAASAAASSARFAAWASRTVTASRTASGLNWRIAAAARRARGDAKSGARVNCEV